MGNCQCPIYIRQSISQAVVIAAGYDGVGICISGALASAPVGNGSAKYGGRVAIFEATACNAVAATVGIAVVCFAGVAGRYGDGWLFAVDCVKIALAGGESRGVVGVSFIAVVAKLA